MCGPKYGRGTRTVFLWFLVFSFLSLPSSLIYSQDYSLTEEELTELEATITNLENLLKEQEIELVKARLESDGAMRALSEAQTSMNNLDLNLRRLETSLQRSEREAKTWRVIGLTMGAFAIAEFVFLFVF